MTLYTIRNLEEQKYKSCELKKGYKNPSTAKKKINNMISHKLFIAKKVLIYECPYCKLWHFTFK